MTFISFQLFFQRFLTSFMGFLARSRFFIIKNAFIFIFSKCYAINMSEAIEKNPFAYASFHDFFIRRLNSKARPINPDEMTIASPADGVLSEYGFLKNGRLLQAKGKSYSLSQLLAKDAALTALFDKGAYALIYLAPHNYHRVHMPMAGRLIKMIYVPGTLFSVSPKTAEKREDLFAKNERVIAIFETEAGKMAVILVGAMIVGSIVTTWAGQITPPRCIREVTEFTYKQLSISLKKGQELGYFSLGSTVIILFEENKIRWKENWKSQAIQMGQDIADIQD